MISLWLRYWDVVANTKIIRKSLEELIQESGQASPSARRWDSPESSTLIDNIPDEVSSSLKWIQFTALRAQLFTPMRMMLHVIFFHVPCLSTEQSWPSELLAEYISNSAESLIEIFPICCHEHLTTFNSLVQQRFAIKQLCLKHNHIA